MTDIKELALRESKDMLLQHYYDDGDYATFSVELCTRFLAAYLAEQKPVARVRVTNAAISWSAYYPTTLPIGEYDLFTTPPLPEPSLPSGCDFDAKTAPEAHLQATLREIARQRDTLIGVVEDAISIFGPEPGVPCLAPKWMKRAQAAIKPTSPESTPQDVAALIERLAARADSLEQAIDSYDPRTGEVDLCKVYAAQRKPRG